MRVDEVRVEVSVRSLLPILGGSLFLLINSLCEVVRQSASLLPNSEYSTQLLECVLPATRHASPESLSRASAGRHSALQPSNRA